MRAAAAVILLVVALLAVIWLAQRRMIYFPTQAVPSAAEVSPVLEEVSYLTDDGLTLEAWFLPSRGEPHGSVLVFNGNAGNRSHRLPLGEALAEAGFSALLVDYRGYGGNPGDPHEEGLATDARAALAYLRSRPDVDPRRVAYFGESLGAGVAAGLAVEDPPAALILRSPFTSLADIASVHYPLLPASLLLRDRYATTDFIGELSAPLLVVAGSGDSIVPLEQSRAVFEAADEPKRLVVIEGAGHNDFALNAGEEMIAEITAFLLETMSQG
ncbi:MAG: alpha/beta hydrolase [Acidimicrobiia bacterium]